MQLPLAHQQRGRSMVPQLSLADMRQSLVHQQHYYRAAGSVSALSAMELAESGSPRQAPQLSPTGSDASPSAV